MRHFVLPGESRRDNCREFNRGAAVDSGDTDRQVFRQIERAIARLLSFALLAQRIAALPRPLRFALFWILRPAHSIAHDLVLDIAADCGFWEQLPEARFSPSGDSAADMMRLAAGFDILAQTLQCLLSWLICQTPQASAKLPEYLFDRIAERLGCFVTAAVVPTGLSVPAPDTS